MKGRMSKKDLDSMIKEADGDNDGFINCKGSYFININFRIFTIILM